eukprot:4514400-Pleurochrysis_carterae.AAC.1
MSRASDSVRSSLADVPPAFRLPQSEPSPAESVVSRFCSQLRDDVLSRVRVRLAECLQTAFPAVSVRRDYSTASLISRITDNPGFDALCTWSVSLEEALMCSLTQA